MDQWKIIVKDKYPVYISWETFKKIQDMLKDNYSEYDRNKSRGVPREGAALLHGIVCCGECGLVYAGTSTVSPSLALSLIVACTSAYSQLGFPSASTTLMISASSLMLYMHMNKKADNTTKMDFLIVFMSCSPFVTIQRFRVQS